MTERIIPVVTQVGTISGRDAIFLDKVNVVNESTFELIGEFNSNLCSNLQSGDDRKYKITFNGVLLFKMLELDFDEIDYVSSFDTIENSKQISKMLASEDSRKIDKTFRHFIFRTYDTVFEIVGKDFELNLLD